MSISRNFLNQIDFNKQFSESYDLMENTRTSVFITGKAGTGKSTLLQYFLDHSSKNVAALAPTGVAALNILGQTIHSFFRFKPDVTLAAVKKMRVSKSARKVYENLDAIVIDEISMVRADMLDCIDLFLRMYGKNRGEAFGGIQMIFVGDLFQLPPVLRRQDQSAFLEAYKSPYFFDAKSFESLRITVIELNKIYRQNEEEFIHLLGGVRNNKLTYECINKLNKRFLPSFKPAADKLFVYLATTNAIAEQINFEKLCELKSPLIELEGEMTGEFAAKDLPTHECLRLKQGAQIMMLNNDSQGRWINGSVGKVISASDDIDSILIELADGDMVEVEPYRWEMYEFTFNSEEEKLESSSVGFFKQYPLKLAWAVTIHKSQGMTFDNLVVDFGHGAFAHGQAYVALSRCSSLEGLVLRKPFRPSDVILDQRVVDFSNQYSNVGTT